MQDTEVCAPAVISCQPVYWIIITNQCHTNHSFSHHKPVHLNMAPPSLITTPVQNLPHTTAAAGKLAATIPGSTFFFLNKRRVLSGLKVKKKYYNSKSIVAHGEWTCIYIALFQSTDHS